MNKETRSEMEDELRPEYDLAELLKGGVRSKYISRYRAGSKMVVLAPDVAQAFPTEEAVNEAFRLVVRMAQIPQLSSGRAISDMKGRGWKVSATMFEDPIIEELHKIREEIAAESNYDLHAIVTALRHRQQAEGRTVVSLPPKRVAGISEAEEPAEDLLYCND